MGMFGGGKGKRALSAIAEAMATFSAGMGNPAGAAVMQNIQGRRKAAADAMDYERQREDGYQDWLRKQQWQVENTPRQPHRWESNDGSLMELGPDGLPKVVYKDPTPRIQFVPNGMGGVIPINPQAYGQPAPQTPSGGDDEWDYSDGGAGPSQAPRPFRKPY